MTQYMDRSPRMPEGVTLKKSEKDKVVENRAEERRAAKSGLFDVSLVDDAKEGTHAMPWEPVRECASERRR